MTYSPQKWIDFHIHTFPDKLFTAIRAWFVNNPGWRFPFEGGSGEIVRYLEGMEGLEKYLCFGYAHKPGIAEDLNHFYLEIIKASPKALALGAPGEGRAK